MLQAAIHEKDRGAKDDLFAKAIKLLLVDPQQIDMTQVVPVLAKDQKFLQIVHIALQKIRPVRHHQLEMDEERVAEV